MKPYGSKPQDRGRVLLGSGIQCPCCPDRAAIREGRKQMRKRARAEAKRQVKREAGFVI